MAIDEKKLLEELEKLPYINGNYDKKNANLLFICGAESFYEMVVDLINEQPKISLENKTSDWIPVEKALPKENGNYLVSGVWGSGKKTVGDCEFLVSDGYFDVCWNFNVLAWQLLPKPYEG